MKVTLLKKDGRKEVINRVELVDLVAAIKDGRIQIMGSVLLIIFLIMIHYCLNSHCLP